MSSIECYDTDVKEENKLSCYLDVNEMTNSAKNVNII